MGRFPRPDAARAGILSEQLEKDRRAGTALTRDDDRRLDPLFQDLP
jgi:hypothetical protein